MPLLSPPLPLRHDGVSVWVAVAVAAAATGIGVCLVCVKLYTRVRARTARWARHATYAAVHDPAAR